MSKPRNCRHCSFMVCGDANWCSEHKEVMSDMQIWVARKCPQWEWNEIDAPTFEEWTEIQPRKCPVLDGQMAMELGGDA